MNIGYITTFSATEPATEHVVEAQAGTAEHTTEPASHGEESEGIAALGIGGFALVAQAITFILLLWLLKKFALDGIVKTLDKRHDDINRGLHLTSEMDKQKAELEMTVEKAMRAARAEGDLIIAEAKTETGKMIQSAEEKANHRAEEILRAAEGKIERDISEARDGLKSEMAGLITEATEAILTEKLDANGDRKLVEKYLSEAVK